MTTPADANLDPIHPGQDGAQPGFEGTPGAAPGQGTPPAPDPGTGDGQPGSGQPQSWASVRDYLATNGMADASQRFQSDTEAIQYLMSQQQRAQDLEQLAQWGQQYVQHAPQFQEWQRQQQLAAQPQQPQQPKWWNPPEFNPAWTQALEVDQQTGSYRVKPGHDPSILPRFQAYQQYRRDFADRLLTDPQAALAPMIEERARAIAEKAVQDQMGQYGNRQYADNFLRDNSQWLYARDQATGQVMINRQTRQPALSQAGVRFFHHLADAEQTLGIRDVRAQERYARSMLEADVYREHAAAAQGRQNGQQANQTFVNGANRVPSPSGVTTPAGAAVTPPPGTQLTLREQLEQAFKSQGITDEMLRADPR